MLNLKRTILSALLGVGVLGGVAGCESGAGTGALIGGASGAGLGAIIGNQSHGRGGEGALIGGAVGAAAGALIGNEAEKRDRYERDRYYYDDRPRVIERERVYDRPYRPGDRYYESRRYEDRDGRYYEYREYER
jgi:hypothetical protein